MNQLFKANTLIIMSCWFVAETLAVSELHAPPACAATLPFEGHLVLIAPAEVTSAL